MSRLQLALCSRSLLAPSLAPAYFIGAFPGLSQFIELSDLVVVARITCNEAAPNDGRQVCDIAIERVLKGDKKTPKKLKVGVFYVPFRMNIEDHSSESLAGFAGGRELIFLKRQPQVNVIYVTPSASGNRIRLSSLSDLHQLRGKATRDAIVSLLRDAEVGEDDFFKASVEQILKSK